jgi:hypothetical protein
MAEERTDQLTRDRRGPQPNKKDSWDQKPSPSLPEEKREQPASGLYSTIRAQIESQYNTSNQRVFWLILSQSFFFNAFVMLVNGQPPPPKMPVYNTLMWIIPAASLMTIIFTYIDVIGSMMYVNKLRRRYQETGPDDTAKGFPPINGDRQDRMFARVSPYFLPGVFILIWVFLLLSK